MVQRESRAAESDEPEEDRLLIRLWEVWAPKVTGGLKATAGAAWVSRWVSTHSSPLTQSNDHVSTTLPNPRIATGVAHPHLRAMPQHHRERSKHCLHRPKQSILRLSRLLSPASPGSHILSIPHPCKAKPHRSTVDPSLQKHLRHLGYHLGRRGGNIRGVAIVPRYWSPSHEMHPQHSGLCMATLLARTSSTVSIKKWCWTSISVPWYR